MKIQIPTGQLRGRKPQIILITSPKSSTVVNKSHHVSTVIPVKKTAFASKWFINSMRVTRKVRFLYNGGIFVTYTSSAMKGLLKLIHRRDYFYNGGIIVTYKITTMEGLLKVIHRLQWRDYCKLYIKCINIEYNI